MPSVRKAPQATKPANVTPVGRVAPNETVLPRTAAMPLANFLAACCIQHDGAKVTNPIIWQAYQTWCATNEERHPLGRKGFSQELERQGFRAAHTGRARIWRGIGLTAGSET